MPLPSVLTAEDLAVRLFSDDRPALLDIRIAEDLASDPGWFPGAARLPFDDLERQLDAVCGRTCVVICHGGLKLSQGVASRLRYRDIDAVHLAGGVLGWRRGGLPLVKDGIYAPLMVAAIACNPGDAIAAWCTNRFAPEPCEILRVEDDQVIATADRFGARSMPDAQTCLAALDRPWPALEGAIFDAGTGQIAALIDAMSRNEHLPLLSQTMASAILDTLVVSAANAGSSA